MTNPFDVLEEAIEVLLEVMRTNKDPMLQMKAAKELMRYSFTALDNLCQKCENDEKEDWQGGDDAASQVD